MEQKTNKPEEKQEAPKPEVKQKGPNPEEKALETFTELLVAKIKSIQEDWKKPWFTEGAAIAPRNLSGRYYGGNNALFLQLHAEKEGYNLPIFATFDRIQSLNFSKDKEGKYKFCVDKDGNKIPKVSVNKGEKSFPVSITIRNVWNPETKERINFDDWKLLPQEERDKYRVFPSQKIYQVFAIDQTNIKEARPELYAKLEAQVKPKEHIHDGTFQFPAMDRMISQNLWHCPIKEQYGDEAYYSISKDEIVVPERKQFTSTESFYSNLFHEMAHSTGAESRLNRLGGGKNSFNSSAYAAEECKAELTAAVVASRHGITKTIKSDSAAYLKSWLDSLHEDPSFLKSILGDVKHASNMINQRIEKVQNDIDLGRESNRAEYISEGKSKSVVLDGNASARAIMDSRKPDSLGEESTQGQELSAEQVAKEVVSHGMKR